MPGLFEILNIGKSGLFASQGAISTTGHNISNADTDGYSRQRVRLETNTPYCMPSVNNGTSVGQYGTGVSITAVERIRDSFLDFQVRDQTSIQYQYQARDNYLSEVEDILDEPSDTGIANSLSTFFSAWQSLVKQPQTASNARTVVANDTKSLCDSLNNTYNQLQDKKNDVNAQIKDDVLKVNTMLNQVDTLNKEIMDIKITGQEPNDLEDSRDLLLDQLSEKFGIKVSDQHFDGQDVTSSDYTTAADADLKFINSDDNSNECRFSYIQSIDQVKDVSGNAVAGSYKITYYVNGDSTKSASVTVTGLSSDQYDDLNKSRILWTDKNGDLVVQKATGNTTVTSGGTVDYTDTGSPTLKTFDPSRGEINGYTSVQDDIDSYTDQLNSLAKALAFAVNAVESGVSSPGEPTNPPAADANGVMKSDYMPFFVNSDAANSKYVLENGIYKLYDPNGADANIKDPTKNLKDVLDAESNITAGNISINKQIIGDPSQIKTRENDDKYALESENTKDVDTDGSRALSIGQLTDSLLDIQSVSSTTKRGDLITSLTDQGNGVKTVTSSASGITMSKYFQGIIAKLGTKEQEAKNDASTQESSVDSLKSRRNSVSGVSLDEEEANLVQYNHAYQASAKVISTVDELLDVVIKM